MPSVNGDLGNPPAQQVASPGEEAFLRSLFNMSGESPMANTEARAPPIASGEAPMIGDSALSVSPQDRFGPSASSGWSSHYSPDVRSSSFNTVSAPQSAPPPPPPPPATFAPEPTPFPYDMGSFIAGLRAAWEAEQATKRMTARRGSPLAPPSAGTSAWGSHGPPQNPSQP